MIKYFFLLFLLFPLPFFLSSCHKTESIEKPTYGGHLIIGDYYPIDIINPIISSSGNSGFLIYTIFNGLVKPDEHFNVLPDLAYKWESSKDGMRWKFHLRKGVKFHDGKELTAEDVEFTYDLIKNPKYRGYYTQFFEAVDQVNIIDPYTIEIHLNQPYAPLLSGLTVGILPRHIYSGKNLLEPKINQRPIGTGPFKVLSYSPKELILEANKDYFENPPFLERITFRIFKDQKTLFSKMLEGSIDAVNDIDPENIDILKQVSDFKLYKFLKPFYYIFAFQNKGIFKDRRVRIALNYAINKKDLLKSILRDDGEIASGTVFPQSWAYNKQNKPYPYDPQRALNLLHDAGWRDSNKNNIIDKNGLEFEFTILLKEGDSIEERSLLQIQADLNRLKIYAKTKKKSMKIINKNFLLKRKFDAIILSIAGRGDPDNNYKFWHSSQISKGLNLFSYKNVKVDNYLENGRRVFDRNLRKNFYDQFQVELFNDPPGVFLFWTNHIFVIHERFKGVKIHHSWMFDLKNWHVPKKEQRKINKEN